MANKNQDWDDLGRSIQDIVDRAVNSRDFQKLNQTVSQAVGKAVDMGSEAVRKAMEAAARPTTPPARPVYREVEATVVEEKKDLPVLYAGTGGETAVGLVKIVGGGLALLTGFISLISLLVRLIMGIGLGIVSTVITVGGVVAGTWLIVSGIRKLGWVSRFKMYKRTLGAERGKKREVRPQGTAEDDRQGAVPGRAYGQGGNLPHHQRRDLPAL